MSTSKTLPAPRVEVVLFRGRTSGFQQKDHDLGRVQLIARDLRIHDAMAWNEPVGVSPDRARRMGEEWASFLGWPLVVIQQERQPQEVKYNYNVLEVIQP